MINKQAYMRLMKQAAAVAPAAEKVGRAAAPAAGNAMQKFSTPLAGVAARMMSPRGIPLGPALSVASGIGIANAIQNSGNKYDFFGGHLANAYGSLLGLADEWFGTGRYTPGYTGIHQGSYLQGMGGDISSGPVTANTRHQIEAMQANNWAGANGILAQTGRNVYNFWKNPMKSITNFSEDQAKRNAQYADWTRQDKIRQQRGTLKPGL